MSPVTEMVVPEDGGGQRLDRWLCSQSGLGRAAARRVIEAGEVRVNGRIVASAGRRLVQGDRIELLAPITTAAIADSDAALSVVYEDAWLVVADKPAGMPSHPLRPGERRTFASALLGRFPEMADVGYSSREPGIVHRLDTDTSGLMLAARDAATFAALTALLDGSGIDKRYVALCAGHLAAPTVHEAWLSARGPRVTVRSDPFATAESIRTEVLHARSVGAYSLVTVRVERARRHQIRAHLAALGHPIAGDARYGGPAIAGLSRHFLHASELHFVHPHSGTKLSLRAPLPVDLENVLAAESA